MHLCCSDQGDSAGNDRYNYPGAYSTSSGKPLSQYVIFSGEGVRVASVKLEDRIRAEKDVETAILRLRHKTTDFPLSHSVAFMVACVARGKHLHKKANVESTIFKKHFPNTPLIGFFANGEIGMEYPMSGHGTKNIHLVHGYTTFFTLVSFPSG